MAKIGLGLLGPLQGTLGNVVGYHRNSKGVLQRKSFAPGRTIASGRNLTAQKMIMLEQMYNMMGQVMQNTFFCKEPNDNYYYSDWVKLNYKAVNDDLTIDLSKIDLVRDKLSYPLGYYAYMYIPIRQYEVKYSNCFNLPTFSEGYVKYHLRVNMATFQIMNDFQNMTAPNNWSTLLNPAGSPGTPFFHILLIGTKDRKKWTQLANVTLVRPT